MCKKHIHTKNAPNKNGTSVRSFISNTVYFFIVFLSHSYFHTTKELRFQLKPKPLTPKDIKYNYIVLVRLFACCLFFRCTKWNAIICVKCHLVGNDKYSTVEIVFNSRFEVIFCHYGLLLLSSSNNNNSNQQDISNSKNVIPFFSPMKWKQKSMK